MLELEERVDRLEAIFGRFMARTELAIARIGQAVAELKRQAELDREEARQAREEARQAREEARRERRELARQLGDISHRLGTVVEDMIIPSLRRMGGEELNCGELIFFAARITKTHPDGSGRRREFEGLYVGQKAILLNESKATARPEYAADFVKFLRSGEFLEYFPEYAGKPVAPVFSSLYVPDDIVAYLTKNRVYAVGMGDEAMEVLNLEQVAADGRSEASPSTAQ